MSLFEEVFTNLVVSLLVDLSNSFIAKIWNVNANFNTLREDLHDKLKELQITLNRIHSKKPLVSYTQLPSDWLDELVWCHYEIEDTIHSFDLALSNQCLSTKMLQANLDRIEGLQNKLQRLETNLSGLSLLFSDTASIDGCHVSPVLEFIRVRDREAIIRELICHSSGVSIIGMDGTGKTKLAESIVDDASIKDYFTCIVSPPPSHEFNPRSVLEKLPCEQTRILIQLHGLQSITPEDWYHFHTQCQNILNLTIKVLITTQNPHVADVTGSHKYRLPTLSAEDCFLLICKLAEANNNLHEDDIQAIKHNQKELVEKCKGLPLLATQIGLLLSAEAPKKRDKIVTTIATCSMWKQPGLERVLLNLTPVSMLAQKQHLQRCVAYCSLFPPDHEFIKDNLVQLWMVEGFTHAPSTIKDPCFLEQDAIGCFEDLLSYSIFQTSEEDPDNDEEPSYKMHQLLYDLAQNIASKTFRRIDAGDSDFALSPYIRHLSFGCEHLENHEKVILRLLDEVKTSKGLRTFLLLNHAGKKIPRNPTFFEKLECLRVLDLSRANLTKPLNISKLKHLRYLDLSYTPIKKLCSLSKNTTLLVLKLKDCDLLRCLPNDLSKLTNLICLEVNIRSLGAMPQYIGKVSKLQSLNVFIVGKDKGYEIAELKSMNDLRESLCITKLENVETKSKAQEAMLYSKKKLERLELQWTQLTSNGSEKEVLDGLQPHKNLKELIIREYNGSEFPQWLGTPELCGMLKTIHLAHCKACTILPSLGKLPMLKTLYLEALYELSCFEKEFFEGGFISLESFRLSDLRNLTEWTQLIVSYMPRLRELQIVNCEKLSKLPPLDHLVSLETLEVHECAQLEELPTLPQSVKSLIITNCGMLRQGCYGDCPDWHKIRGINVLIDSERLDLSRHHPPASNEPIVDQSNDAQIESTPTVDGLDSRDPVEHPLPSLSGMDASEKLHQQEGSWQHRIEKSGRINNILLITKRRRYDQ